MSPFSFPTASARAPSGCSPSRSRLRATSSRATRACSRSRGGRSASSRAGGTVATCDATTTWRARRRGAGLDLPRAPHARGLVPARRVRLSLRASRTRPMSYAELHCLTNFSFLRGASHAEELVERAAKLGYSALAITDECSVAGVVRAHHAARERGLKLIVGSELRLEDGLHCVLLATNRRGYGQLCRLITRARRAAPKGQYRLGRRDFATEAESEQRIADSGRAGPPTQSASSLSAVRHPPSAFSDLLALWLPQPVPDETHGRWLASVFPGRLWIAVELLTTGQDRRQLARLQGLGERLGLPLVAAGDVHMHARSRRALQDVLIATRIGTTVDRAGYALFPNGERHLRPLERLAAIYPPELMATTLDIAARCTFSLDELRYEYPREIVPEGDDGRELARQAHRAGQAPSLAGRRARARRAGDRARARADRRTALRGVLPHRPRHRRASRARAASSARAAARRPTRPSATASASPRSIPTRIDAALRALHLARAQRAARHRRRLRARAARGGDPVHLREVRPRPRRRSPRR